MFLHNTKEEIDLQTNSSIPLNVCMKYQKYQKISSLSCDAFYCIGCVKFIITSFLKVGQKPTTRLDYLCLAFFLIPDISGIKHCSTVFSAGSVKRLHNRQKLLRLSLVEQYYCSNCITSSSNSLLGKKKLFFAVHKKSLQQRQHPAKT